MRGRLTVEYEFVMKNDDEARRFADRIMEEASNMVAVECVSHSLEEITDKVSGHEGDRPIRLGKAGYPHAIS